MRGPSGRPPCRTGGAVVAALLLSLCAATAFGAGSPQVILQVPLVPFPGTEEWAGPLVDQIFEEKLGIVHGLVLVEGEKRQRALQELTVGAEVGAEELAGALAAGEADYAIAGQFMYDAESFNLDIRFFSAEESRQTGSFQKPTLSSEVFDALAEAVLFVAAEMGVEVTEAEWGSLRKKPTTSFEAYHLALSARMESDTAAHLELLKEAVDLDPDYLDANLRLGLGLYRVGRAEDAVHYMQRAVSLGPDMPEARNNLAVLYAHLGRNEEALEEFGKALELRPDYPEARLNYGRLLEETGKFEQAESVYIGLLDADPDSVKVRSSLAQLYERTGRTELAIQEFRILSQRNPELAENYFIDLGIGARKAKEFENAEKFFLRAVDINPQFSRSYAELGTNSYLGGDYDKSMEYFRKALALEPQRPEYHHYLGMALERSGLQEEARESFQRSAELGGPPETRVSLAKMYLSSGEVNRAIDELNLVLEESPSDEEAKVLLVRAMDRAESEQKRSEERAEFATHRLTRLESIIEDLTRSNRSLESRALSLRTENQEMDRELEELKGQAGGLSREKEKTEEALNELRQERAAQGQELDGLRDQLTVLRSEKDSWNEELEGLKELAGRLSGEKAQVEEEMARLREELAAIRSGKDSLGEELSAARAQAEEVRSASKQLQTRLTALEQESYRRIEEARGKAAVELSALGKELEASRKREQEALLGQERLLESLRSVERVREELEKVRRELAEQSLELGGMYMKNRSWDKAAAAFQRVLEVDPGNAQVYYSLGEIYFQLGRFDLSKDMYRKAKEIF